MTPEQLREWADAIDGEKPWAPKAADVIDQLRAHADALERLKVAEEALASAWAGFINLRPDERGPMSAQFTKHANECQAALAAIREKP